MMREEVDTSATSSSLFGGDRSEDRVALVIHEDRTEAHDEPKPNYGRHLKWTGWLLVCVVATIAAVLSLTPWAASIHLTSSDKTLTQVNQEGLPEVIRELGWTGAMEKYRVDLADILVRTRKEEEEERSLKASEHTSEAQFVDISPVYDHIENAIDTFGAMPVFLQVFNDIEWYYPDSWDPDEECDTHGDNCVWQDDWWLWHYVGAVAAEKLIRQGSLLADVISGDHIDSQVAMVEELHRRKEQPFATVESFHMEHGFIWHTLAATMPDLDSYPEQLADDFCRKYEEPEYYVESANKYIGFECFHGFGHGVYMVMVEQQLKGPLKRKTIPRPMGDFVLTDEAFCKGLRICDSASNATSGTPAFACRSGFKHSYRLLSRELNGMEKKKWKKYFVDLEERVC